MRVVCMVGTQLRHIFLLGEIVNRFNVVGVVFYERTLVQPPKLDASLFTEEELAFEQEHLRLLKEKEDAYFSKSCQRVDIQIANVRNVSGPSELNSIQTANWLQQSDPDVVVDYGTGVLTPLLLDALPSWTINLHGGLSPYYKGSATLLWPFYLQQPELAGVTFHSLSRKIDEGSIYQHVRPEMYPDDTVSDIGCRAIQAAGAVVVQLLNKLDSSGELEKFPQRGTGKLFLERDYRPSILKVVYDNFANGFIERYLAHKKEYDAQYSFIDQLGIPV